MGAKQFNRKVKPRASEAKHISAERQREKPSAADKGGIGGLPRHKSK